MDRTTVSTTALLDALGKSREEETWLAFDERYRPVLLGLVQRVGLSAEEAADVVQESLLDFVRDLRAGKFDRSRGRVGQWLVGIARHRMIDRLRRRDRSGVKRGDSALDHVPADPELDRLWDEESQRHRMALAMDALRRSSEVKPETIEAFRRYALDGQPAEAVAEALGIPTSAVYVAKHRCLARLRELVDELQVSWEG